MALAVAKREGMGALYARDEVAWSASHAGRRSP